MATKDWKKIGKTSWKKKNIFLIIYVRKIPKPLDIDKWETVILKGFRNKIIYAESYKTKSKALAYAKAYMRTH